MNTTKLLLIYIKELILFLSNIKKQFIYLLHILKLIERD